MSLLMEALRKAEEAKRKGQAPHSDDSTAASEPTTFSLVPDDRDTQSTPATELLESDKPEAEPETPEATHAFELEEIEADEVPEPVSRKRVRVNPANRPSEAQLAAASIFAAKQQAPAKARYLKPILLALALMLPLIGGGLWYLQQSSSGGIGFNPELANVDVSGRTLEAPPADPAPEPEVLPDESPAEQTASATDVDTATASTVPPPGLPETATALEPDDVSPLPEPEPGVAATEPASPPPAQAAAVEAAPPAPPQAAEADTGSDIAATTSARLQVSLSREPATVNSTLQSAWNTLQAGDEATASRLYEDVLRELPNNRDALLGLAVIHTRNGRLDEARRLYAQALTLNPQDPLARTGLLQTMAGSGSAIERELLSLRDSFPELAPIHFALGNLYAARQSWNDAQGAYFDALVYATRAGNGPVSPDYAFNLAVSLEQLQQPQAALDYYRQAQTLAQQSAPGFDPALLRSRLVFLEQNLP